MCKLHYSRKSMLAVLGFVVVLTVHLFGIMTAVQVYAQSPDRETAVQQPAFDVVSIKAHPHGYWRTFSRRHFTPDGFIWTNAFVEDLIVFAYDLKDPAIYAGPRGRFIPGGPKWIATDWYDGADIVVGSYSELKTLLRETNGVDPEKNDRRPRSLFTRRLYGM